MGDDVLLGPEARSVDCAEHDVWLDVVAAMEKVPAEASGEAGCRVMNRAMP